MMSSACRFNVPRLLFSLPFLFLGGCGSPEERAQGYYQKGMELIAKHDDLNARVQLHTALNYKADRVDIWRALVGVEERLKSEGAVFQDLRRVVELDPHDRSEEHTSELQSPYDLVCRLLLEKKKKK